MSHIVVMGLRRAGFQLIEAMVALPIAMLLFAIVVGVLLSSLTSLRIQGRQEVCRRLAQEVLDGLKNPPQAQALEPVQEGDLTYLRSLRLQGPIDGSYLRLSSK